MSNFTKEQMARFRLMDFIGFRLSDLFRAYNSWDYEDISQVKLILNNGFDFMRDATE